MYLIDQGNLLEALSMSVRTLEVVQSSARKRTRYTRYIIVGLTIVLILMTGWLSRWEVGQKRPLLDFDAFYIVAQRVWLGDAEQAYHLDRFTKLQMDAVGGKIDVLHWTYPPQFDLLVAPLALIPVGAAYFLFIAATLAFYLLTLRAIAKGCFALVVILLSPALFLTLACGQNGFLTGGLIGLACLTIERRQLLAGLSLGLMVIKPHLAVAIAVYALLARRWIAVVTATAVILLSAILCTLLLGPQIWSAFLGSVQDSSALLERGGFALFRSISVYAVLRTAGLSPSLAFLSQLVVAVFALSVVALAIYRNLPARWSLGLAAIASVLISPYAYDYDLPILGVGMALLLPDLTRLASELERVAIYSLMLISGFYGLLQVLRLSLQYGAGAIEHPVPAFSGFALLVLLGLTLRVLLRGAGELRLEVQRAPIQTIER
ncbi:glycosyltransferase family 87 protein [Bradyrhizobium sp. SSUT77]|uniref:glycosyltransferase family 87 protein n=1 Tax=Bradyrhizobium sp. SSUT77 TaxID=3040603 RepID=UPI0024481BE2|nr:glycosyltransferase family 87 protein [Bradyrhizobium sp. SSUT77]MDH2348694.1 glycosyltransferase family 87 protein [Bradyrhizobium sp. SSUT77]